MGILISAGGRPSLIYPFRIFPLRVLKQVVCMFFSVNDPLFHKGHPELVRFVLNRESRAFPGHARVYAFYTLSDRSRAAGATGVLRGFGGAKSSISVFSEITFPPFGFVLAMSGTSPPAADLCDISGFSQFGYRDWRDAVSMRLPTMSIYTPFPGDYRTREQTLADRAANELLERQVLAQKG
jgi:hypothetical protein